MEKFESVRVGARGIAKALLVVGILYFVLTSFVMILVYKVQISSEETFDEDTVEVADSWWTNLLFEMINADMAIMMLPILLILTLPQTYGAVLLIKATNPGMNYRGAVFKTIQHLYLQNILLGAELTLLMTYSFLQVYFFDENEVTRSYSYLISITLVVRFVCIYCVEQFLQELLALGTFPIDKIMCKNGLIITKKAKNINYYFGKKQVPFKTSERV